MLDRTMIIECSRRQWKLRAWVHERVVTYTSLAGTPRVAAGKKSKLKKPSCMA